MNAKNRKLLTSKCQINLDNLKLEIAKGWNGPTSSKKAENILADKLTEMNGIK